MTNLSKQKKNTNNTNKNKFTKTVLRKTHSVLILFDVYELQVYNCNFIEFVMGPKKKAGNFLTNIDPGAEDNA
jgi:hypothetical protein